MKIIGDFHIHGPYAMACSKNTTIEKLEQNAKIKGLNILGTGDCLHPKWFQSITSQLTEDENGILWTKNKFPFIWQTEISLMYTHNGRGRRIHHVILLPNKEIVEQVRDTLLKRGRLDYDGRPIFGINSIEFVDMLRSISKDIEIIPAHCLPPQETICTNKGFIPISELDTSFKVLSHKGNYKEIEKVMKRKYVGEIIGIKPAYYNLLTKFTPEHPIYLIKSFKDCKNSPHTICKPTCAYVIRKKCKLVKFKKYCLTWVQSKNVETGDIAPFPINKNIKDINNFKLKDFFTKDFKFYAENNLIKPKNTSLSKKNKGIPEEIKITDGFCRLIGYYLSEGYVSADRIGFAFHESEEEYIKDVKELLKIYFRCDIIFKRKKDKGTSFEINSKILCEFFKSFYIKTPYGAENKSLPPLFLELPVEKQKQIFIGWWRGDKGNTSSVNLINQMWHLLLRLKIIPVINLITADSVNKRRLLKPNRINGRDIIAKADCYNISHLIFFDKNLDLLEMNEFKKFKTKLNRRKAYFDENYVYLPIIEVKKEEYKGYVYNLEVKEDNSFVTKNLTVHNCWTSWFSIFGSKSGFDSVEECFEDRAKYIHAIETGMSSDPVMNRRISKLDKYNLVSFSDPHSYHPWRLGREATMFDVKNINYKSILNTIRTGDGLAGTIEVNPSYGKYHVDGHRACGVVLEPEQTKKLNGICPVCKNPLTIGVAYRIEELADRQQPKNVPYFKEVIPLTELIASLYDIKLLSSKKVWEVYNILIKNFNNEYNILLNVPFEDLKKVVDEKLARLIILNRDNKLNIIPGYDGVYGKIIIDNNQQEKPKKKQQSLKDF